MTKTNKALKKLGLVLNGVEPEGEHTWEILDSMAEGESLALTVTPATDSDDTFDKQASDLQENILVGENAITGTLKYVTGYLAYTGDEQNGNFLALKAVANKDGCAIVAGLVGGTHGNVYLESDGIVIFRVTSTTQKVRFVVTKGGQSKEYVFDLDDIVLGEPAAETATLTYLMGQYADGGNIPFAVTEEVGSTVNISFTPHPTREGYIFMGWALSDGSESASYSDGGTEEITLYGNVTLYPVFVEAVTLTYSMGAYADGGSVPSPVTSFKYDDIDLSFSPHPTREGYNFIGWAETDGADHASYYEDMATPTIYMDDGDVTLYPVFAAVQPSGEYIEIVNNSSEDVEIFYEEDKEEKGNTTISAGSSNTISIDRQYPYYIRYSSGGSDNDHNFNGTYHGSEFYSTVNYYLGNVCPPNNISDAEWSFQEGDHGTLTISDHQGS